MVTLEDEESRGTLPRVLLVDDNEAMLLHAAGVLKGEQVMASVTADLEATAGAEISDALRHLLADVFTVFLKTKGFHWHIGGRHFRDYHLLLDGQASQIFAMVDEIAERARKLVGERCDRSPRSRETSDCGTATMVGSPQTC